MFCGFVFIIRIIKMSVREDICRLCLKMPHIGFLLIDGNTRQGLDVLSVRMNLDVCNNPLICDNCMEIIKRLLSFILACLNSEKTILLFNTMEKKSNTDIGDVYAFKSKQIVQRDSYICRFCIKKVNERNSVPLDVLMKTDMSLHMLKEYIFQMEENIIKHPLICFECRGNMEDYFKFLRTCHDTEEKINMYRQHEGIGSSKKIMLPNVFERLSKSTLEYSNRPMQVYEVKKEKPSIENVIEFEIPDMYNLIENVKQELATEDEEVNNSFYLNEDLRNHVWGAYDMKDLPVTEDMKIVTASSEFDIKDEMALNVGTRSQSNVLMFEKCICSNKTMSCSKCNSQFEIVSMEPKVYKCKLCPYQGAWIKSHMLRHRDISELTIYKCSSCDFETKYKSNLKQHSLSHRAEADLTMYKCTACDFNTKYKDSLQTHMLIHKTEAELTMYKCTDCDYKTKRKHDLKSHSLTHKTKTELTMYKCKVCDYMTMHKSNLRTHVLFHKPKAELTMYKCTACDFKTRYRGSLKGHSLTHKTDAEVTMYKCTDCDYKTRRKHDLKSHSLTHKTKAELTMYKCKVCDYMTMHKSNLRTHVLFHKPKAELTMYKCTDCDFKTRYQRSLKRHSLTHKTDAEVTMYNCAVCDFSTKYKRSLQRHMLTHKTEVELEKSNDV